MQRPWCSTMNAAEYWIARSSRAMTSLLRGERVEPETSPDRWCVLDAAGAPELIEAARNAELRSRADIALIDFTVIPDAADDAAGPVSGQPEFFAVIALGADQPHHIGFLRLQRFVDVL